MQFQKNRLKVQLFSILFKFAAWLQDIPNKVTPPPFRLIQIGSAFWQSRLIYVAAHLDIATVLAGDSLHVDQIATRVSSHPDATYRMLRMLSAMGIFEESSPRTFKNNKLSNCLREGDPQNIRAMIMMHNSPEMSLPWYQQLEAGIKSGDAPFSLTHQQELFAYTQSHTEFSALFSSAMDNVESLSGDSYATDFDWGQFSRIIDVGGSKGSKSVSILKRHAQLTALVIDQEKVISEARQYWQGKEEHDLFNRLSFQAGDVLETLPAATSNKDIYFLSAVLHGFDDATCIQALTNIAAAIADSGARIALMELVMNETNPDFTSTSFDMQMFMGTRGRERTLPEWNSLFSRSGLTLEEVVSLRSFGKILVLKV
jgi:hypothetical protein